LKSGEGKMKEDESGISIKMTEILEQLIMKKGFELPFFAAVVGTNGSCLFFKYSRAQAGLKVKFITEHIEDQGIGLPINMMLVDAQGKALNFFIQKPPDKYEIPNCVGHA
jgi:hypothetical protein